MARPEKIRLGDLLVKEKIITHDQLDFALEQQKSNGRKLGRVLVENGFVTEEHISEALAMQFSIPYVNLKNYNINLELVRLLPESQARRFRAIVLEEHNKKLLVGMSDPTDFAAMDEITRLVKRNIDVAVVTEGQLLQSIDRGYLRTEEITGVVRGASKITGNDTNANFASLVDSFGTEDVTMADLLKGVFDDAMRMRASDIHIEPQEGRLTIRFRIDGVLHLRSEADNKIAPALVSRLKLMAGLDISENRFPQTGRLHVRADDHAVDVRISTMPTQYGESALMRLLSQDRILLGLDKLGMSPEMLKRFRELIQSSKGMVLATGPAGSGKSAMLYAALAEINTVEQKIITVEDPVEYLMPGINQTQVDEKIKLTFSQALHFSLLQDPDVIMISEMRDEETAQAALRAAMTGHLVFSAIYANDSASALFRLVEMGMPRFMVASSVRAVVAQRLLRRVCDICSELHVPNPQESEWLKAKGLPSDQWGGLLRGRGCAQCNGTGYHGRTGVFEMLEMGREMTEAAAYDDATHFMQAARQHMRGKTIIDHALEQMKLGRTTITEVMRISIQVDD
ncbi:MAG: type II/IV secretion system protein [Nitrosomonadales bacterium]|nr:type II/IV secretion system protein [Nitrosomonadales bacterium]